MDGALDPIEAASPRRGPTHIRGKAAVVVILVKGPGESQLLVIADALDSPRLTFGFCQRRQKQRGKNSDDRDDDQELNQRETIPSV